MVQSTSWEANWFAARQEIPRISRNPKVNYRTHKRPPPLCNDFIHKCCNTHEVYAWVWGGGGITTQAVMEIS